MLIALSRDFHAQVSPEDLEPLSAFSWCADVRVLGPGVEQVYAVRYTRSSGKTRKFYMHREIVQPPEGYLVDHMSGDTLDNRRCNLRIATSRQNRHNTEAGGWTSQYKGVSRMRAKWRARLFRRDRDSGLKEKLFDQVFEDEIEAAKAYDIACLEHLGEFARLNFPLETYRSAEPPLAPVEAIPF